MTMTLWGPEIVCPSCPSKEWRLVDQSGTVSDVTVKPLVSLVIICPECGFRMLLRCVSDERGKQP